MAKKSIGELHAKVTADATQFVDEFKRADNASRRSSAAINTEVDKLTKGIKRKFELADFGKDLLRGAGLFGGFSIINTGVDHFVGMIKEAEAYTKRVDDSAASIAEKFREISSMRIESSLDQMLPEAQLAARKKQLADIENQLRNLEADRAKATAGMTFVDKGSQGALGLSNLGTRVKRFEGESFGDVGMGGRDFYELMLDRADKAQAAMPALQKQADALRKQIEGLNASAVNNAVTDFFGDLDAAAAAILPKVEDALATFFGDVSRDAAALAEAQAAVNKRLQEAAALTLAVRTPLEKYTAEIERLNEMEKRQEITTETAARAMGEAAEAYAKASGEVEDYASRLIDAGKAQDVVGQKATAWSSGMAAMWENVADRAGQSFADILITGENTFSSLVDVVARSVIEMAARLAIINPLINGLFGLSGRAVLPAFYGTGAAIPGRAMGGGVEAGVTYRVNEAGEEFFKSNTGGTIIPAGISAGMGERGGGDSYAFNYSFATGVTKAELGPLLALNQRQTLAQLADIRRRGGATARAY
jgi:hypothetical protein